MRQRIAVAAAILLLATGCFLQKQTAWDVLNGIGKAVYAGMETYGELVKADLVPPATQTKVRTAYAAYQDVMIPAVVLANSNVITPTSPEVVKVREAGARLMSELTLSGCPNCVLPTN